MVEWYMPIFLTDFDKNVSGKNLYPNALLSYIKNVGVVTLSLKFMVIL